FEKFNRYIDREDLATPRFKSKVYARHYAGVFLNHVKNKNFQMALSTLKYLLKAPATFVGVIWSSFIAHIKAEA
ncbi:MAG: hypothetical protein UD961_13715, partial [Bacteroidales bacterium]|nr:hypothetical protein [Bacteroidales bacterium]